MGSPYFGQLPYRECIGVYLGVKVEGLGFRALGF